MDTVNSTFTYDGVSTSYTQAAFDCNLNYYLFARNDYLNSTYSVTYAKMKIYQCKIYASGVLVRNYIPVIRNSDNKPGMYDVLNKTFYVNSGTGEFVVP